MSAEEGKLTVQSDEHFMKLAYREAERAFDDGEVPIGAVVVCDGRIIARAYNMMQRLNDVTAHAEMQAITAASEYIGGKYLDQCTLYVTLEPCVMCAGALYWAQFGRLVFGAYDERRGYQLLDRNVLHPTTKVESGVMGDECAELLKRFFATRRSK